MQSLLRTRPFTVEDRPEIAVTLRELSAASLNTITETVEDKDRKASVAAVVCQIGVIQWNGETVDDIQNCVSSNVLVQIMKAIYELSGMTLKDEDETVVEIKKNGSGIEPVASSSFASPLS